MPLIADGNSERTSRGELGGKRDAAAAEASIARCVTQEETTSSQNRRAREQFSGHSGAGNGTKRCKAWSPSPKFSSLYRLGWLDGFSVGGSWCAHSLGVLTGWFASSKLLGLDAFWEVVSLGKGLQCCSGTPEGTIVQQLRSPGSP